jgi:hypothetical protein
MADIRNQVLEGRQELDGNIYYDCEFRDAVLVFKVFSSRAFRTAASLEAASRSRDRRPTPSISCEACWGVSPACAGSSPE